MAKMTSGYHYITMTIDGVRGRFFGEFSDDEFYGLPYINEYGHTPPGMQALREQRLAAS